MIIDHQPERKTSTVNASGKRTGSKASGCMTGMSGLSGPIAFAIAPPPCEIAKRTTLCTEKRAI